MSVPAVSVVVPAFNAAEFLEECLESVARQSLADLEVLVVDDGSTDATASIASRFAAADSRFRVVTIPNGGVSRARNVGIDAAQGEWLSFVDADDVLHPRALEAMLEAAGGSGAEVVVSAFRSFGPSSRSLRGILRKGAGARPAAPVPEVYGYREAMRLGLYQKRILNSPWGVLLKRSLLGADRRFREGSRYEDLDAFYRFYEGASAVAYLRQPLYFYRRNPAGFIRNWSEARLDVLDVVDRMAAFFRDAYPELEAAALDRRFSAHFNMLLLMRRGGVGNAAAMERCRRVVREGRRRALRDPAVRLKNKLGALLSYLFI